MGFNTAKFDYHRTQKNRKRVIIRRRKKNEKCAKKAA